MLRPKPNRTIGKGVNSFVDSLHSCVLVGVVMARPLRIQYPGAVYHVMNRGGSRQKIFLEKEDYETFVKTIREIHERWGVELFAYCLMGNHYHICLLTPEGNLSRVMRHLDGLYTQRFNRIHRRDGALLRGRYKAIVVDKDNYLAHKWCAISILILWRQA